MVVTGLSTSVEPGSLPRCALLLRTSLVLQVSKAWQLEPFCCINALAASLQTRRGRLLVYALDVSGANCELYYGLAYRG